MLPYSFCQLTSCRSAASGQLADIQYVGCPDLSEDKVMVLGKTLKEIYDAKLAWQFPGRPCRVEFFVPDDRTDLIHVFRPNY